MNKHNKFIKMPAGLLSVVSLALGGLAWANPPSYQINVPGIPAFSAIGAAASAASQANSCHPKLPVAPPGPRSFAPSPQVAGACLPLDQPIPFTIQDGYYDMTNVVGGRVVNAALSPTDAQEAEHLQDLQSAGIDPTNNPLYGTVTLERTQIEGNSIQGVRESPSSHLEVDVSPGQDNDATIHGTLMLKSNKLQDIACALKNRPKTFTLQPPHNPIPEWNDICVTSISVIGKFVNPGQSKEFKAEIILHTNTGRAYEMEAMRADRGAKPDSHSAGDSATYQYADYVQGTGIDGGQSSL